MRKASRTNFSGSVRRSSRRRTFNKVRPQDLFREYCEKSTVHGVKYLAEEDRPAWEKILWIILFALSIFACGKLIERAWSKLSNNPLAVTFAEKAVHITQIPFPAVTICTSVKFRSTAFSFSNYTDHPEKYKYWKETYRNLGQLCENFDPMPGDLDDSILNRIRDVGPTDLDMMKVLTFRDDKLDVGEYFHESFTSEGLCYTFNRLPLADIYTSDCVFSQQNESFPFQSKINWTVETGFGNHQEFYPLRASNTRQESGLTIILQLTKKDIDIACRRSVGFTIQFHSPSDVPRMDEHAVIIPVDRFAQLAIEPNIINTPRNIEIYPPEKRQCFFNSERQLQHFRIYSERNCKMECLANWTLAICNCVQFFMPRNNSVPICGPSAKYCIEKCLTVMDRPDVAIDNITVPKCNCMPSCVTLSYNADLTHSAIDYEALATVDEIYHDPSSKKFHVYVMMYFNENKFYAMQRSELFGQTDFISSVGGFLGLFMGISVLSLAELVYFATVRWFQHGPMTFPSSPNRRHKKEMKYIQNPYVVKVQSFRVSDKY
ncbi:hypothetical protein DMENIID0001_153430 [Sergentomyia squamirostris]